MKEKLEHRTGCRCCPRTEDILPPNTVLYQGFGGYHVQKNGKIFYSGDPDDKWENFKTLSNIEKEAKKSPKSKWTVILNNPLRGATWKRIQNGEWKLIETNKGFA